MDEFKTRLKLIAADVRLTDNFHVRVYTDPQDRHYLQIAYYRKDVVTGEMGWGYGGKAYPDEHLTSSEIVQIIFGLYKGFWEHEARETFEWRGRRVFGPHISTEALWEITNRTDASVVAS